MAVVPGAVVTTELAAGDVLDAVGVVVALQAASRLNKIKTEMKSLIFLMVYSFLLLGKSPLTIYIHPSFDEIKYRQLHFSNIRIVCLYSVIKLTLKLNKSSF